MGHDMHQHEHGDPHDHPGGDVSHTHNLAEIERLVAADTHRAVCRIPGCSWSTPWIGNESYDQSALDVAVHAHLEGVHDIQMGDAPYRPVGRPNSWLN